MDEKLKLKIFVKTTKQRVCLSLDTWKLNQSVNLLQQSNLWEMDRVEVVDRREAMATAMEDSVTVVGVRRWWWVFGGGGSAMVVAVVGMMVVLWWGWWLCGGVWRERKEICTFLHIRLVPCV
ncbi:hypothetical protein HanIR_Chr03g0112121 [Helianthus annuus]|nr:hypothetical protein HanIR_Chr03g0112121 [Helianthus annuus]